jgi:hypothetical protein
MEAGGTDSRVDGVTEESMKYAIGERVDYILDGGRRCSSFLTPAVVKGIGKRRDNGRTYYVIKPNNRRVRCVAESSLSRAVLDWNIPAAWAGDVGCGRCHKCLSDVRVKFAGVVSLPVTMTFMVLCPRCGNKRCPRASDHWLACTDSNEPGQPGSIYTDAQP